MNITFTPSVRHLPRSATSLQPSTPNIRFGHQAENRPFFKELAGWKAEVDQKSREALYVHSNSVKSNYEKQNAAVINLNGEEYHFFYGEFSHPTGQGYTYTLHPVQDASRLLWITAIPNEENSHSYTVKFDTATHMSAYLAPKKDELVTASLEVLDALKAKLFLELKGNFDRCGGL